MRLKAKTAISIPSEYLRIIEKIREKTGKGRSQIITEALGYWIKMQEINELENRYIEGYKKIPENTAELNTYFKPGLPGLGKERW